MAPGAIYDTQVMAKVGDSDLETRVQARLVDAISRFETRHKRSKELHDKATLSLPGGNTRTLLHTTPFPISLKAGRGYQVYDEDGLQ